MQNTAYMNAVACHPIKDNVLSMLKPLQAPHKPVTASSKSRRLGEPLKAPDHLVEILFRLRLAPPLNRVIDNALKVSPGVLTQKVGAQAVRFLRLVAAPLAPIRFRSSVITAAPSSTGPRKPSATALRSA